MRTLHRHILAEMLRNASVFLGVIVAMFFVMALALTLGKSAAEGVPIWVVFRATWYEVVANLNLILPLTILSAAIFTYGRARSEGEFTATRVAGIHPYQVLVPVLLVGSLGTFAMALLQDEVMPAAHFARRQELTREVLDNLNAVLRGSRRDISQERWCARWSDVAEDADGQLVLLDLLIINRDRAGALDTRLHADEARPRFSDRANLLQLTLNRVRRWDHDGQMSRAERLQVNLNLDAFDVQGTSTKRDGDRSYEELLTRASQLEAWSAFVDPVLRKSMRRKARRSRSLYHQRISFAFSALILGLLGASLGLWRAVQNRALVFLAGFLIVMGIYYPLQQWGRHLATSELLPPGPALWIGNLTMAVVAAGFFRRVIST